MLTLDEYPDTQGLGRGWVCLDLGPEFRESQEPAPGTLLERDRLVQSIAPQGSLIPAFPSVGGVRYSPDGTTARLESEVLAFGGVHAPFLDLGPRRPGLD